MRTLAQEADALVAEYGSDDESYDAKHTATKQSGQHSHHLAEAPSSIAPIWDSRTSALPQALTHPMRS